MPSARSVEGRREDDVRRALAPRAASARTTCSRSSPRAGAAYRGEVVTPRRGDPPPSREWRSLPINSRLPRPGRSLHSPLVKLAHIADPHLGIRQYHRQTPTGINQREADVANAFRGVIDESLRSARPVVVAGDLFHSVRPTNAAIVFAFRQFQRLRDALARGADRHRRGQPRHPALVRDRERSSGSSRSSGVESRSTRRAAWSIPALDSQRPRGAAPGAARPERPELRPSGPAKHRCPGHVRSRRRISCQPAGRRWSTAAPS